MAFQQLTEHFAAFFTRLNPAPAFEQLASRDYTAIKTVIEGQCELKPTCFLQGSYRQQTAIHSINDVDVVALCRLWQPGGGDGLSWSRDAIFAAVAAPLLRDGRYRARVRYGPSSTCIKLDLGSCIEILPVAYKAGTTDPAAEPFRLFRPETRQWEDGFARRHRALLSQKNAASDGNFIPMIKVLKHLRSITELSTVSFHLECLLYALPDNVFRGPAADYIPAVLQELTRWGGDRGYTSGILTPCGDRALFSPTEWDRTRWNEFNLALGFWLIRALEANTAYGRDHAIAYWRMLLGTTYFPERTP